MRSYAHFNRVAFCCSLICPHAQYYHAQERQAIMARFIVVKINGITYTYQVGTIGLRDSDIIAEAIAPIEPKKKESKDVQRVHTTPEEES